MTEPAPHDSSPAADPYRWVILFTATLTQAGTAFVFLGVGALAGFIQESFDLSGAQTGMEVIEMMEKDGISPDVTTWNTLLR